VERPQLARVGDLADDRPGQLPLLADRPDLLGSLRDAHHSLLALGDHDLPGLELLAERHPVELDVDPGTVAGHLGQGGGEPGCAAVL
jgi:hypothetical protein